ncbi:hypothetical protein PC123_g26096 [Phytophthora cactorum]|nr:hypothetical protein PC123_g26096 [Phytophthora cactorum]
MRTRSGRHSQVDQGTRPTERTETTTTSATVGAETKVSVATATNSTTAIPVSSSSIVPPYVDDVSHLALVKWKRERLEYEDAIEARCATTGEDKSKALRSVKNSFNRQLLKTLCKFEWGTTVEEVMEDRIVSELDKIIGNVMNDVILDVDAIFDAGIKMDLQQRDVKARVLNYFMKCDEIILQHGLASTFSTATGVKEKCRVLKKHLAPAALRDTVDTHIRLVDSTSKSDENALYALVKKKALEQVKVEQLLAARKQQPHWAQSDGKFKNGSNRGSRQNDERSNLGKKPRSYDEQPRTVLAPKAMSAPTGKSKPRSGCFHCARDHWLSECPDLDEAGKEAILAERRNKKKTGSGNINKRARAKRVEPATTNDEQERPTVVLNGVFELPYCADSGSDYNIVSRCHADQLCQLDETIQLVKLCEPIESRAVGGTILTSTHAVDVNLTLNTAAGPVRCQDVKRCLIVESDEDEFLVGKTLLSELGIDVDRQLEYLASRGDDDETFDELEGMPACKLTPADVVMNVVDTLVRDAVDRGVVDEYITTRLHTILHRFGGWRLEAGAANSPEKSEFLDAFNKKLVELGWVYENRESRWCCPAHPAKNPSSNEYRQAVDYRPTNVLTEPIAGVMPSIEVALERCQGMM